MTDTDKTADKIRRRERRGPHATTAREAYERRGNAWVRHERKRRRV